MKVRKGFVSNSSSSSFVINVSEYDTVYDLAKAMIVIRDKEHSKWNQEALKDSVEIENIKQSIRMGRDPNEAVYLPTSGYNTCIMKVEDQYVVTSSRDYGFDGELPTVDTSDEVNNWFKQKGYYYEEADGSKDIESCLEIWDFQCGEVFRHIVADVLISRYDYFADIDKGLEPNDFCKSKKHWAEKVVLHPSKEAVCPICYAEKKKKKDTNNETKRLLSNKDRPKFLDLENDK